MTETNTTTPADPLKTVASEELKAIWQRLTEQCPEGCRLTLHYKAHFGVFGPSSYVGRAHVATSACATIQTAIK